MIKTLKDLECTRVKRGFGKYIIKIKFSQLNTTALKNWESKRLYSL